MAKKKELEISYSELTAEELNQKLDKAKEDLFKLRFRAASATLKNPMEIRFLRKEVARLNTFLGMRRNKG